MSGRVVVAGGTGFIGGHLIEALKGKGFEVILLTRRIGRGIPWDGKTVGDWASELDGAYAVINLAGSPIAAKWSEAYRDEILHSRVDSTKAIGKAISQSENPPLYWINGSATGYYGDRGDTVLTETATSGHDFLGRVCSEWEEACWQSFAPKTHKTVIRIGFVIGRAGGAYPRLAKLTRAFLGGSAGSGRQWLPWIHVDDLARLFLWALHEAAPAVVNGVAPNPVTNGDFMRQLRSAYHRPWSPPVPAFCLKAVRAISGFPAPELLLGSQRATPSAAQDAGFTFRYPELADALKVLTT